MTDTKHPSILFAGGGYVLSRVAQLLPAHSFIITSRQPENRQFFINKGWATAALDFSDPRSISQLLKGNSLIKTVVDSVPPSQTEAPSAIEAQARGRGQILRDAGISGLIYLSTTGVFGIDDGREVTELSANQPKTLQAQRRMATEDGYKASGIRLSILRIPAIYGPGRGLRKTLQSKHYYLIDQGERWTNRVHVADLSCAIAKLVEDPERPGVLCTSDDHPTRQREVVDFYCKKFGLPYPLSISKAEAEAKGLSTMLSNQRINNAAFKQYMGGNLKYPSYREGAETE